MITLVGAGPVGSLLALYLAKRNIEVEIFERRPDMRLHGDAGGRSINLALSTRGLHALGEVGLGEKVLKMAIPMLGRMVHFIDGKTGLQRYGKNDGQYINSVSRRDLNKLLMTEAEKTGKVKISFNQRVTKCDLEKNILEIEKNTDPHSPIFVQHKFIKVIGTDGSASTIRQKVAKGKNTSEKHLNYGYKELHIPPGPGGSFLMEKNALHIWPRGTYMLIALPNFDGSFTATLFLPHQGGELSFESLKTSAEVEAFFQKDFGDALKIMPHLTDTFFGNPLGHMVTVKCSPWNYDGRALLLGDAAHAMVPFFGQGMNCGFEDCSQLNEALGESPQWEKVFADFSKGRKPHTDAIADMAVENFIEMRDKVADGQFILEKNVEKILQEKFPGEYIPRYQLVTFSRVPYAKAYEIGMVENKILSQLCKNIKNAVEVDLDKAHSLIGENLSPLLQPLQKG